MFVFQIEEVLLLPNVKTELEMEVTGALLAISAPFVFFDNRYVRVKDLIMLSDNILCNKCQNVI